MFVRKLIILFLGFFLAVLMHSCEIINPKETIPSYIKIDSIGFSTLSHPEYGSSSHKISDAWVYADDQLIGAFELPAIIPILLNGSHKISIKAGIKVDGISESRAIYPFYESYTSDINLVPGSVLTINPNLTYNSYTVFEWKEAFEDGGISLEKTLFSDTIIEKTSDPSQIFEGGYSGVIHLDENHSKFQGRTINSFVLPKGDSPVFLEMNYKTDEEILVGLFANSSSQIQRLEVIHLLKTDVWKKIYINLNNAVNRAQVSDNYQVFFEIVKSSDAANSVILLDNLKLLHN